MPADLVGMTAPLPQGLHARVAGDADIERGVEFINRFATPAQWMPPSLVRRAMAHNPEPLRLVVLVEDDAGAIQGFGAVSDGGLWASSDHSWRLQLRVAPEWTRRGVGRAVLGPLEAHAKAHQAARLVAATRGNEPEGLRFAEAMGYRAYHQRIDAYLDVARFDADAFEDPEASAARIGVRLAAYGEIEVERGSEFEAFQRALLGVVWAAGRDVPSPTPSPEEPPPFEQARKMFFDPAFMDAASTIIALRDGRPIGATATVVKETGVAYTNFTGVSRDERGKGIALMLKLRALRELRARGVRLYGTTNDETNAAMRGINRRLGYAPEPPTTMVEKRFT